MDASLHSIHDYQEDRQNLSLIWVKLERRTLHCEDWHKYVFLLLFPCFLQHCLIPKATTTSKEDRRSLFLQNVLRLAAKPSVQVSDKSKNLLWQFPLYSTAIFYSGIPPIQLFDYKQKHSEHIEEVQQGAVGKTSASSIKSSQYRNDRCLGYCAQLGTLNERPISCHQLKCLTFCSNFLLLFALPIICYLTFRFPLRVKLNFFFFFAYSIFG